MARYVVEVAPLVLEQLEEIKSYIANDLGAPNSAERVIRSLLEAMGGLESFPFRNAVLVELPDGREIRRAKAGNYFALYVVAQSTVSVVAIVHSSSDITKRVAALF